MLTAEQWLRAYTLQECHIGEVTEARGQWESFRGEVRLELGLKRRIGFT